MTESTHTETTQETKRPGGASAGQRFVEQGRTVREDVRELGSLAREAAGETLDDVRRRAGEQVEHQKERAAELEDELVQRIRTKPIQSVLIAAGAGAVLGVLFSRR